MNQDFYKWHNNPVEKLHAEFWRNTPQSTKTNTQQRIQAELGQNALLLKIEKGAVKFWQHLKTSDPTFYHFKALKSQELNAEKGPLTQLIHRLQQETNKSNHTQKTDIPAVRMNTTQIINMQIEKYLRHWNEYYLHIMYTQWFAYEWTYWSFDTHSIVFVCLFILNMYIA